MKENYLVELVISPLVQAIRDFPTLGVPLGAGDANWFRPLADQILTQFGKLMESYEIEDEI